MNDENINEYERSYDRLLDIPDKVLAERVVTSLIMCKGNLNKWSLTVESVIKGLKKDANNEIERLKARELAIVKSAFRHCINDCVSPECDWDRSDEAAQSILDKL